MNDLETCLRLVRQRRAAILVSLSCRSTHGLRPHIALGTAVLVVEAGALALTGHGRFIAPTMAFVVAAGITGIGGFAFSPICQALLAPFQISPVQLVQTLMICSVATQCLLIASLWRVIQWRQLPVYLAGGILGLPFGVHMLLHFDAAGFHMAIGSLLIGYGCYVLLKRPVVLQSMGWTADLAVGFMGGVTGGLAAFPGAAITVWCSMKGWDKSRQRGVYQPFILVMQLLALAMIALMRAQSHAAHSGSAFSLVMASAFVPGTLLGTWLGMQIFRRISDRGFERCTAALLIFAGGSMMF